MLLCTVVAGRIALPRLVDPDRTILSSLLLLLKNASHLAVVLITDLFRLQQHVGWVKHFHDVRTTMDRFLETLCRYFARQIDRLQSVLASYSLVEVP